MKIVIVIIFAFKYFSSILFIFISTINNSNKLFLSIFSYSLNIALNMI